MYAVIKSGGKQYRVTEGQTLRLEKLPGEVGEEIIFEDVLLLANEGKFKIGAPCLSGVTVTGKVIEQGRAKKINIIKFKRRKHHLKRMGHRQSFTAVQISVIGDGRHEQHAAIAE
jgi:large subunit ribosomal protein L21